MCNWKERGKFIGMLTVDTLCVVQMSAFSEEVKEGIFRPVVPGILDQDFVKH